MRFGGVARLMGRRSPQRSPGLPLPPPEMRVLVGPTEDSAFDNPSGADVYPGLDSRAVLDFGAGCGRVARQLAQQTVPPERYVGVDLHRGMVEWCRQNLPVPGFEFHHHNVFELGFNPAGRHVWLPFPVEDSAFSLVIASSVFTHVLEPEAPRYLEEVARVLEPGGTCAATWLLFDKTDFPVMQDFQNALFINAINPTNAVIYDRAWLLEQLAAAGLKLVGSKPPSFRGFLWELLFARADDDRPAVELGVDDAPPGRKPPPMHGPDPHRIGL